MTALMRSLPWPLVDRFGWALVHFLWQGIAIAAVLALVFRLLRNRSANTRYLAAWGALVLMAACVPLTAWLAAPSPVAVKPTQGRSDANSPQLTASNYGSLTPVEGENPPIPDERTAVPAVADLPQANLDTADPVGYVANGPSPMDRVRSRLTRWLQPILPWTVGGWLIGALALSLWHLGGCAQLIRLRHTGTVQVARSVEDAVDHLCHRFCLRRPIQVFMSTLVAVPTVLGWLRPVILLPASVVSQLSPGQLEMILAHELAHVRRCDYLWNLLQIAIETMLFYHPAIWWVSRRIREERECGCDEWAVATMGNRLVYAEALLRIAELRDGAESGVPLAAGLAASGGALETRIRRVLRLSGGNSRGPQAWLGGILAMVLLGAVFAASVVWAEGQPKDKASHEQGPAEKSMAAAETGTGGLVTAKLEPELGLVSRPRLDRFFYVEFLALSDKPLKNLKTEPKYHSRKPLYGELPLGLGPNHQIAVAVDEAKGETPRIFIDRNRDRDLTNDGPGEWASVSGNSLNYAAELPNVAIDVPYPAGNRPYHVSFFRWRDRPGFVAYRSHSCRQGVVKLDGREYKIALQDENFDGRFDDRQNDALIIDVNQDGRLESEHDSAEFFKLSEPFNVRERGWEVAVAVPDGLEITLRPSAAHVPVKPYLQPGTQSPEFVAPGLDGKTISLKDEVARSKYVLLSFWASSSETWREEFPQFRELVARYKGLFQIVGVNEDHNRAAAREVVERFGLTCPQVFDGMDGQRRIRTLYRIQPMGENYLLDKNLAIVAKNLHGAELANRLRELLGPGDEKAAVAQTAAPAKPEKRAHDLSSPKAFSNVKGFKVTVLPKPPSWKTWAQPIRAVALRLPYVYVLSRAGNLFIAKIVDGPDGTQNAEAVGEMERVGDGVAMITIGDRLLCSRAGGIVEYSLADPSKPTLVQQIDPSQSAGSKGIIRYNELLFVVSSGRLSAFDVGRAPPRCLATVPSQPFFGSGCAIEGRLYAGQSRQQAFPESRNGVAIYDLTRPAEPQAVGFVETQNAPYQVLAVDSTRIAVLTDSRSFSTLSLWSLKDPTKPAPIGESMTTWGRTAAVVSVGDQRFLVTNGAVFAVGEKGLQKYGGFTKGSNTDGFPYYASVQDNWVALPSDWFVALLTCSAAFQDGDSPSVERLGAANANALGLIHSLDAAVEIYADDRELSQKASKPEAVWRWSRKGDEERMRTISRTTEPLPDGRPPLLVDTYIAGGKRHLLQNWDPKSPPAINVVNQLRVRSSIEPDSLAPPSPDASLQLLQTFYRDWAPRRSLEQLIKASPTSKVVGKTRIGDWDVWQVRIPDPGVPGDPRDGCYFDVYLDPSVNFHVRRRVTHVVKPVNGNRMAYDVVSTVTEFKDLGDGVFFPVYVETESIPEKTPKLAVTGRILVKDLTVNKPLPTDALDFKFPEFAHVRILPAVNGRNSVQLWGPKNKPVFEFRDMEELLAYVREKHPELLPPESTPGRPTKARER
jgi:beta-lactamase regulating signal transducer with metallopeptidase domain/peroxiredoxin